MKLYVMIISEDVFTGTPSSFSDLEIDDFAAFVLAGGEVSPTGLKDRIQRAFCITFVRENGCLLGVGGLKKPSDFHRQEVQDGSNVKLGQVEFPFELGWVFVLPSARGRKLSAKICNPLIAAAGNNGVFATSHESRTYMHQTLERIDFVKKKKKWPSQRNEGNLYLFLRSVI